MGYSMLRAEDVKFDVTIIGFHGTLLEKAKKIIADKKFEFSEYRKDHWLGQGIYFFREDYHQAKAWALTKVKRQEENGAILKTIIKVDKSSVLNLDARDDLIFFTEFKKEFVKYCTENKIKLSADPNVFRCTICDELPQEIKVIQRTFPGEGYFNGDLKEIDLVLHGVQVCVRDKSLIDFKQTNICGVVNYIPPIVSKNTKKRRKKRIFSNKE